MQFVAHLVHAKLKAVTRNKKQLCRVGRQEKNPQNLKPDGPTELIMRIKTNAPLWCQEKNEVQQQ